MFAFLGSRASSYCICAMGPAVLKALSEKRKLFHKSDYEFAALWIYLPGLWIQWNLRIMDTLVQGQLPIIQGMSFIRELLLYPHLTLNLIKHWSNDMIQLSHSVFERVKYWSSVDWTSDLAWHDASSDIREEAVEACRDIQSVPKRSWHLLVTPLPV